MRHQNSLKMATALGLLCLLANTFNVAAQTGDTKSKELSAANALADAALNAKTIDEKEKAAVDLAASSASDATEALLRVLDKSKESEVLVAVIDSLGNRAGNQKDIKARDCMPKLVEILADEKGKLQTDDNDKIKRLRARAYLAIVRITGADYGWDVEKDQSGEDQMLKLKETLEVAKFYIAHPPPK